MSQPIDTAEADSESSMPAFNLSFLLRVLAMAVTMLGTLGGLHAYVAWALVGRGGVSAGAASLGWTAVGLGFGSLFLAFIGGRVLPHRLASGAQWVGFGWMGAFALLVPLLAVTDVGLALASLAVDVSPAAFAWRAALVVALVGPALAWGAYVARRPARKAVEVTLPGLHPELDGFKVVQLSDVHIGETLGRDFAQAVTDAANREDADAIVITGDLVDGSVTRLAEQVAPLAGLRARHGVFFVTGNHEYYSGGAAWEEKVAHLGLTVLHNEHRVLQRGAGRLVMAGVTDLEGARFSAQDAPDLDAALAHAPMGAPVVLLSHQPRFAKRAAGKGIALMLSGHTHAGQIVPFNLFVPLQQPVLQGLATLSGVLTYTSPGTGYWGPPFRVGTRGEVTVLTLRAG